MSSVNTVLGPIPAEELGFVAVHEHIGYGMPGSRARHQVVEDPEQRYEETVPKLREFHRYGGRHLRRRHRHLQRPRRRLLQVAVGQDRRAHRRLHRFRRRRHRAAASSPRASVDYLTRQFIHEITVGIGDTGSRAGVIKVGVSRGGRMTDLDKRIYRAAARAALQTGVPILTHLAVDVETAHRDLPRGGAAARPRALRARRRRRQRRARCVTRGSPSRAAASASTPSATTPSSRTRRSGAARARSGSSTSSASSSDGQHRQRAASADANCSPLGWPGVKGHTVNYIFEELHPGPARRGHRRGDDHQIFVENPADFLIHQS